MEHLRQLENFLENFETTGYYNFINLGSNPCKKYSIPGNELFNFFVLYSNCIGMENLHIAEAPKEYGPLLLDFDFVTKCSIRQYDKNDIRNVIDIANMVIGKYTISNVTSFIMEKYKPTPAGSVFKDGFHIVYPYLSLSRNIRKKIIDELLKECISYGIFEHIQFTNKIESVIDRFVNNSSPWLLYGSSKVNGAPFRGSHYSLTEIYNEIVNSIFNDPMNTLKLCILLSNSGLPKPPLEECKYNKLSNEYSPYASRFLDQSRFPGSPSPKIQFTTDYVDYEHVNTSEEEEYYGEPCICQQMCPDCFEQILSRGDVCWNGVDFEKMDWNNHSYAIQKGNGYEYYVKNDNWNSNNNDINDDQHSWVTYKDANNSGEDQYGRTEKSHDNEDQYGRTEKSHDNEDQYGRTEKSHDNEDQYCMTEYEKSQNEEDQCGVTSYEKSQCNEEEEEEEEEEENDSEDNDDDSDDDSEDNSDDDSDDDSDDENIKYYKSAKSKNIQVSTNIKMKIPESKKNEKIIIINKPKHVTIKNYYY
jgi:hypothetical protein